MPRRICPCCGSKNTAAILWGMPAFSEELQKKLDQKELILGGCCITGNDPSHHCNTCKKDFGISTAELEIATTGFEFSIGGYFSGYKSLSLNKTDSGVVVKYIPPFSDSLTSDVNTKISFDQWAMFIRNLYRCYIVDWKRKYADPDILDGTQWNLKVTYSDRKPLNIYGSNAYPPHWSKFMKIIEEFTVPEAERVDYKNG